jgi:serine/threonine-protein phosphatase 2A regulatory subunit A
MVGPVKTRTSILPKLGTGAYARVLTTVSNILLSCPYPVFAEIFAEGMDPDDQVAKVVSEQLGEFVELVGGPVQVNESLLKPLTVCASVEETVVRDAVSATFCLFREKRNMQSHFSVISNKQASTSLSTIARTLDDTTDFCRIVIEELTKTDNWFTSKVSACAIFEAAYPNANSDTKANLLATFAALAKDSTPMVRRSAAKHIGVSKLTFVVFSTKSSDLFFAIPRDLRGLLLRTPRLTSSSTSSRSSAHCATTRPTALRLPPSTSPWLKLRS